MEWIGIDFGTTNSAACRIDAGQLKETTFKDDTGKELPVPSMISYFQEKYAFGREAMRASRTLNDQSLVITDLKPQLGRKPDVVVEDMEFQLHDLVSRYLKHLVFDELWKGLARHARIGAVFGTPVEFPSSHREALREAARDAGIAEVEFIYEPTAALYCALNEKTFPDGPVAVIDWGGGTVDISIVLCRHKPDRIEDLNVNARRQGLGGRDLDRQILDHMLSRTPAAETWFQGASRSVKSRILGNVESRKILHLSGRRFEPNVSVSEIPSELNSAFELSTASILECLENDIGAVRELAIKTTAQAGLNAEDVRHYLLVGGPFQSALVRDRMMAGLWKNATELNVSNRQMATARGCALLAQRGFNLRLATNVVIREADGHYGCVLGINQELPRATDSLRYRQMRYALTDLSAPEAIIEIGHVPAGPNGGEYIFLDQLMVPVMHQTNSNDNSVRPREVQVQVGLNRSLYVCATASACVMDEQVGVMSTKKTVELSKIPLALEPGTSRTGP